MSELAIHPEDYRVQYTGPEAELLAEQIAAGLKEAGVNTTPLHKPPSRASFVAAEVILTIVATAAAKAVVIAALRAIGRRLKQSKTAGIGEQRLQIVLDKPGEPKKRFPFSLQDAAGDAVDEFISGVIDAVADL
jgi:hypothetical protein